MRKAIKKGILFLLALALLSQPLVAQGQDKDGVEVQKALDFLKKNMEGWFSLRSDNLTKYYTYINNVFERNSTFTNDQFRAAYRQAQQVFPFEPEECDTLYDSQSVSADFLRENTELAYRMWKKNSRHVSFETFCNYILPYRVGHEPVAEWRKAYMEKYGQDVAVYPTRQHNQYHTISMHNRLNKGFNGAVYYPNRPMPDFALKDLIPMKMGNCEAYSYRTVAQLRAFGIPATMDFVPQWGNRSMGHSWAVMFVNDSYTLPVGMNETPGSHFDDRLELTMPKVYRMTFTKQEWLKEIGEDKGAHLPMYFQSQRILDVTDNYVETADVTVKVTDNKQARLAKWLLLGVFNNRDWVPVAFAKIGNDGKARFDRMGKGVAYIPFFYDQYGSRHYTAAPFILNQDGTMTTLKPKEGSSREVVVTRKYWESETLKKYNRQLERGVIVVANDANFKDSLVVATVSGITENRFHTLPLEYTGEYKFIKYISPNGSHGNIAEIELYDDLDSIVKPIRCFGGSCAWIEHWPEKVFDGNVLTSYSRMSAISGSLS